MTAPEPLASPRLYTSGEVAVMFRVSANTASRWGQERQFGAVKTPGGRYRFDADQVDAQLRGDGS